MPTPCAVCASLDRAEIDRRLARQVVNVAALGREVGIPAKTLHRHRERHIPQYLDAFAASAQTLTLAQLQAEAERTYRHTLDALAQAEAGTLRKVAHTDPVTGEETWKTRAVVSHTTVARLIREARAGITLLHTLGGDRADDKGRPSSQADVELASDIRRELRRVMLRNDALGRGASEGGPLDVQGDDVVVEQVPPESMLALPAQAPRDADLPAQANRAEGGGGAVGGCPPRRIPSSRNPQNMNLPSETPEGTSSMDQPAPYQTPLTPDQVRTAAASLGITPESFLAAMRRSQAEEQVKSPQWPGNPAASDEERAFAGYGSIPVTDNRITPTDDISPVR